MKPLQQLIDERSAAQVRLMRLKNEYEIRPTDDLVVEMAHTRHEIRRLGSSITKRRSKLKPSAPDSPAP